MSIRIIGDVHGKFDEYKKVVGRSSHSVQLGDFGFVSEWNQLSYSGLDPSCHKIIKGNHDQYDYESPFDLGNFGMSEIGGVKFFFIRGGISIDRTNRLLTEYSTKQKTWWSQEELNLSEMLDCIRLYSLYQPDIVMSHVPAASFSNIMTDGDDSILTRFKFHKGFKENHQLLGDELLKIHRPKIWLSAHFHQSFRAEIDGTDFISLAELEHFDLR